MCAAGVGYPLALSVRRSEGVPLVRGTPSVCPLLRQGMETLEPNSNVRDWFGPT